MPDPVNELLDKQSAYRSLAKDITLEEAIEILKLGEGYLKTHQGDYKLRRETKNDYSWSEIYYTYQPEQGNPQEVRCASFTDNINSVTLFKGNKEFRTFLRIIRYLEQQNFKMPPLNDR